ncbi:peptidylprolyl isomerase [Sphingomonas sp. CFBP 8760]|uniref:peptidylprolyl isomerase n=1 Tax=Sphingomonas sp. CFBP 8760 TaxID=2775282 RepID=UPI00177C13A2|nr:peptidylprolyl isomerase [Sphingomonas sp. CFBP 8760]MBD8545860.1 peptidylprolyl isomerase [Sphingomonas sp. CFBP 8760]
MRWMLTMALGLVAMPAVAQVTPPAAQPATSPLPRVAIVTSAGRIVVEADTRAAPVSANNFLRYVDQRKLDGTNFYRVVKVADKFGFVQFGSNGDGKRSLPPIRHEPTSTTGLKHLDGTLSTARLAPGTARGEFTVSVGDQPSFDADPTRPGDNQGYAAFGRIVEGMDVVLRIFDAPVSPDKTVRGAFKGEVPTAPVTVLTARRLPVTP